MKLAEIVPAGTFGAVVITHDGDDIIVDGKRWKVDEEVLGQARGHVLIGGLCSTALACALKAGVKRVTVVENDAGVIAAILPHFMRLAPHRLGVICGDIHFWRPPRGYRYGALFIDVGSTPAQATRLMRRYARRVQAGGLRVCR